MMIPDELLSFTVQLAQAARSETLHRWRKACEVSNKAAEGFDPVTAADRAAEAAMRALIASRYPDHRVTGEEQDDRPGASDWSWSLDPVDGTRSFICGLPTWVTLVALLHEGTPVLGLIDAPALDEIHVGCGGTAALTRQGEKRPIRTSGCRHLGEARLSTTDPFLFNAAAASAFESLRRSARISRFGHDGYAYARLAAGGIDIVVESRLKPHDYQALIPLVSAAGGHLGDWRGGTDFSSGNVIAAASRSLYDEALAYFDAVE